MTTVAGERRTLPGHGTYARYNGRSAAGIRGCRCDACRKAASKDRARRSLLNATGRSALIDSAPAAAHLRRLFDEGAGWERLAEAVGCSMSLLSEVVRGLRPRITRVTERKILRLRDGAALAAPPVYVPALGYGRRLQGLVAIGWDIGRVAAECSVARDTVTKLLHGRMETIRPVTARRIDEAFRRLAMMPGGCARASRHAARQGWVPPLAWDDIDDPAERPKIGEQPVRRLAVVEDTAELAALGLRPAEIAERLGMEWASILVAHRRAGVPVPGVRS